jgi:electron transport complex protein RnfG
MSKKTVNKEATFQLTWRLFAICVLAAVLLGATYAITKDPIIKQDALKLETARKQAIPEADAFQDVDLAALKSQNWQPAFDAITGVSKASAGGKAAGCIVNMTVTGYNSGIKLTVGIGTDGKVKGISITEHSETAGLGAKAQDPAFYGKFKDKPIDPPLTVVKGAPANENEVQAITSATITTRGITNAVNTAAAFYKQYFEGKE